MTLALVKSSPKVRGTFFQKTINQGAKIRPIRSPCWRQSKQRSIFVPMFCHNVCIINKGRKRHYALHTRGHFNGEQGDQIWRIFAFWAIVFFGYFLTIKE
jgi:hypothetical protein